MTSDNGIFCANYNIKPAGALAPYVINNGDVDYVKHRTNSVANKICTTWIFLYYVC